jgi:hypothetical protein
MDESQDCDGSVGKATLDLFSHFTEAPGSTLKVIILSRPYLSGFYHEVQYKDLHLLGLAKQPVVGRCFYVACTLGLRTGVEGLLFLTSLHPGW